MTSRRHFWMFAIAVMFLGALDTHAVRAQGSDVLFIGDGGDNTVKRYDATSGMPIVAPGWPFVGGLAGPRGLLFDQGDLLVVNQNAGQGIHGEVLVFDGETGSPKPALVAAASADAPFAPRGMAFGAQGDLFVADLTTANGTSHGEVLRYEPILGGLLSAERAKGVQNNEFHPRGVVLGPDDLVYVSVRSLKKDGLGGGVLRFTANGKFFDVFIDDDGGVGRLNRPEGLVFGPDGLLYVTSFRAAPGDTDAIRIYGPNGQYLDKIDLYNANSPDRVYAQALLFGPGGKLYVPLNNTGEVRCYDVGTYDYDILIPSGSGLIGPWYLTFKQTDPATLQYTDN